ASRARLPWARALSRAAVVDVRRASLGDASSGPGPGEEPAWGLCADDRDVSDRLCRGGSIAESLILRSLLPLRGIGCHPEGAGAPASPAPGHERRSTPPCRSGEDTRRSLSGSSSAALIRCGRNGGCGRNGRMMDVFFTVDVEIWCEEWDNL